MDTDEEPSGLSLSQETKTGCVGGEATCIVVGLRGLKTGTMQDLAVRDVMVEGVITAPPTESAVNIAKIMIEKKVNRIPVIDNDKLVGIVTRGDIIKAVAECG